MGGDLTPLAESFTVDSRRRLDVIVAALNRADAEKVRAEAHSLKGAASSVGAHDLASLCSALEHHMRDGETAPPALHRSIEAERQAVCAELARLAVSR